MRDMKMAEVVQWADGIKRVHECIATRLRRLEPRHRVLDHLRGLLSPVERKNGWQIAEHASDTTHDGEQRLLSNYRWDSDMTPTPCRGECWIIWATPTRFWWWTRPGF